MTYRRRHRWLRRLALGLAFATFAAPAAARPDEGGAGGSKIVTAGGWTGAVDAETGIPLSAGIPNGDEQYAGEQSIQVIPYLSQGILTEADQAAAAAEAIHDPYLTDAYVRQGESLGGPDGIALQSASVVGEAVKSRQAQPLVDESQLLNHRQLETLATGNGFAAVTRPDDQVDRFAHSDVAVSSQLASSGSSGEWDHAMTVGIGALVLALALGLGLGFVKRPRLAGL